MGGVVDCINVEGGDYFVWDGYIRGKNVELFENKKIV